MARINIVNADNKIESNPRRAYFKLKNTGGPKGDTGAQGPQGPKGDTGAQGPAGLSASVTVGSTTTLAPGASATVTNTGDTRNAVLNFGIPTGAQGPQGVQGPKGDTGPEGAKGAKGDTGAAATVTVANTNTGAPGTNASVENVGDQYNAVLNFTIPRGDKGETGATGAQGPAGQDGKDFTPTVVTALPETGENGVLYMTEKAHTTQTATGNPITATITDEAGKMESFQLDGGTFQNSYTGKNLMGGTLNKIKSLNQSGTWTGNSYANNGITWTVYENSDGTIDRIEASGTAAEAGMTFRVMQLTATDFAEKFDTSSTYTLSGCPSGGSSATYYIRVSSTPWKNMLTDTGSGATGVLTPASNYTRVGFTICVDPSAGSVNNLVFRPQLELNSSATAYEPYCGGIPSPNPDYPQPIRTVTGEQTITINGTNYTLDLGTIELAELTDAIDKIYPSGDDWILRKETVSTILPSAGWTTGSWNAQKRIYANASSLFGVSLANPASNSQLGNIKSDHFTTITMDNLLAGNANGAGLSSSGYFSIRDDSFASAADLQTAIGDANIKAYGKRLTATEIIITDAGLIAQLEAIRTALLENGANTIANTAAGSNLAGDMEIGYYGYTPSSQYDKWLWLDVGAAGAHYEQI